MSDYKEDLLNDLKGRPGFAAKYLTAAANDSDEAFLVALRDIGRARTGMTGLAAAAEVNRVNLYHMLSERGNPGIRNVRSIFRALKFRVKIEDDLEEVTPTPSPTATHPAITEQVGAASISDFTKLYDYGIPIGLSYKPLTNPPQTAPEFAFGANGNMTNTGLGAIGYHFLASAKQSAPPLHP
jgi:probable addiction module antidote protein